MAVAVRSIPTRQKEDVSTLLNRTTHVEASNEQRHDRREREVALWTDVKTRRADVAAKDDVWVDDEATSTPAVAQIPRSVNPGPSRKTTTRSVVVFDEIRNERTTYSLTKEFRNGQAAMVNVRFEKEPVGEVEKEESDHATSVVPVNHNARLVEHLSTQRASASS
jgi:hypothetical protein